MKPIEFKGQNRIYGKDQPQYSPLPVLALGDKEGTVISCWELSHEELETVKQNGKIYLQQLTFGAPLQPVYISADLADLAEII